ncbi:enoyl-CoA hydratase/isomerase family protein, partial [Amycolatopsis alba]|uniref:enoyl-CoA hydratase n=1 Tax=Amycolatopsis alba DSM 44262 TaxID=1125972 RepID=A0A229RSP6_AMYAL
MLLSGSPAVTLAVHQGIGTIRLDAPPLNVLDDRGRDELRRVVEQAAERPDVKAVILYGGRNKFSAGVEVRQFATLTYSEMLPYALRIQETFTAVAEMPKPVVAAITGFAVGGGCELALTADHRVCAANARIGLPETTLGVIPGAGGTQRLSRLIGVSPAKEMIYTGAVLSASRAKEIGLVDVVVPAGEVLATATTWAARFTGHDRHARGDASRIRLRAREEGGN